MRAFCVRLACVMFGGAPATEEGFTQLRLALLGIQHPRAILPGLLVAQVLGMAAGQYCHPVAVFILTKIKQAYTGYVLPSVFTRFAFARALG